jgi:hypothetical protein
MALTFPASIARDSDLLDGRSLREAEEVVNLGVLPIPGLFFPTADLAAGVASPVRLVRGASSGLLQLDRDLDPRLYYYYKSGRVDQAHLDHVEQTAADLARALPADASVLEIGGGAGHLMRALHRRGFHRLHTVDPSAENMPGGNYEVIQGMFPAALAGTERKFDIIIGQHFLEHSADPVAVLRAAAAHLTDRGQVWIEVPDIAASALEDGGTHLSIIYALHSAYYDRASLARAGRAAGLALARADTVAHYGRSLVAVFERAANATDATPVPGDGSEAEVAAAIRTYFRELAEFGRTLPPGLLCWGAAERCLTVLGGCMAGGFRPGILCDSNPDLRGLYLAGFHGPVLNPGDLATPIKAVLLLSVRNAGAILRANRDRFAADAQVYIPFAGRKEIAQLLS